MYSNVLYFKAPLVFWKWHSKGVIFKVPGVIFKVPGVISKVPGVIFKVPGVIFKVLGVISKVPAVTFKGHKGALKYSTLLYITGEQYIF